MNNVPSVSIASNNVNFGHKIKYSPEAKAEFTRQMDKYIKFASKPYTEMNLKDFFICNAINGYFLNICTHFNKVQKALSHFILK